MKILSVLLFGLLFSSQVYAYRDMERLEEALEIMDLKISLDASLNGYVVGKMCSTCKPLKVTITPKTVALEKHQIVPLLEAKKRAGKPAFVIFDPKTMEVKKIRW